MADDTIQPVTGSKRFSMNLNDLKKVGKGAVIAFLGAFLTSASQYLSSGKLDPAIPLTTAIFSILVNMGWKYLQSQPTNT